MSSRYGLYGVSLAYPRGPALEGVDVPVVSGDITALIGADGAGKTSACRVLVGLAAPDEGEVRRPPRARLGYQPESAGTWADLTVAENLKFVARAHGLSDTPRRHELLQVAGLAGALDRPAGNLSGGMRQKLAVVMAVLARPSLVVLDEPTTGLDPVSRAELWRLLLRTAAEGTALLVTTSYLDEAERADHVVLLDSGGVVAAGTADSIRSSLPGAISVVGERPSGPYAWRRGRSWRVWSPDGSGPFPPVSPDLDDVVTVAALSRKGMQ